MCNNSVVAEAMGSGRMGDLRSGREWAGLRYEISAVGSRRESGLGNPGGSLDGTES